MPKDTRSLHGRNALKSLDSILEDLKKENLISKVIKEYRIGDPEYKNKKQFYVPYMITFNIDHNEQWALYSTSCFRSDRVKGHQWDIYNIKRLNEKVTKCFLVYPDDVKEKDRKNFDDFNHNILDNYNYSIINSALSQKELVQRIRETAYLDKSKGKKDSDFGSLFEIQITNILNNSSNFNKWKYNNSVEVGYHYRSFLDIIDKLNISKNKVKKLKAENVRSVKKGGGKPKADIILYITFENGETKKVVFSLKFSNANRVSVHEYTANKFADVLNKDDLYLRKLLNDFQNEGGLKALGKEKSKELEKVLNPYREKLALWALGGYNDPDIENPIDYLIIGNKDNQEINIETIPEYYNKVKSMKKGHFGTIFSWTYPSGGKGKRIQLKAPIIFD